MGSRWYVLLSCSLFAIGCPRPTANVSVDDMEEALEESCVSSQAETLLADGVEITTNFTIGNALDKTAAELQAFVASQLPCAAITRDAGSLMVNYGKNPGDCIYHGQTFAGEHTITVMRNASDEVAVHHEWIDFNNGRVSVSGSADVTWSRAVKTRHVQHEITWTLLSGYYKGRTGTGRGDRTQSPLDAGIETGVRVDGTRAWDGKQGHFDLEIDGVEMRWSDPVPQGGAYVLTTPKGQSIRLKFERVDADTINVSANAGTRSFEFLVSSDGRVER